jgi:eukaryotic-like serine/threonine-protein kinase
MSLSQPLEPGDPKRLGRYELLGRLGEGGMGVVFLSQGDRGLVAVKMIKRVYAQDHQAMRRVHHEVEAAKRVPRYCTAPVYDYDFDHNPPFIVSEYVEGPTLQAEVTAKGPLSASDLHRLAIGVALALSGIHRVDVVHGDLTPSNVLLSRYGPRVIDFGIARVPEQTAVRPARSLAHRPTWPQSTSTSDR